MPVLTAPPSSVFMQIARRVRDVLLADADLQSYFGWEDPPPPTQQDTPLRRRIFLDDDGTCDKDLSPKLCITEFTQMDSFSVLGDGGEVDSDICSQLAIVVYVNSDRTEDGEQAKVLVANLHSAVRQVIRSHVYDVYDNWSNMEFTGPSATFSQSKGYRRAGGILSLYNQKRITE